MNVQTHQLAKAERTSRSLSGDVRFGVYTCGLSIATKAAMPGSWSNPEPRDHEQNQKGSPSG